MNRRKEYEVSPDANSISFLKSGFTERGSYYSIRHPLFKDGVIKLSLRIDKEDKNITTHVTTADDSEYIAFWNEDWAGNNAVADACIEEYNKFMDSLVEQGVLQNEGEKSIDDTGSTIIRIKYASPQLKRLTYIDGKSDWIDLHAAENVSLKAGEYRLISLGVAMQLPKGYEALVVPRSSTFKNFGVIQTNHVGVIDNSYCGDDDWWRFPAYAIRDTTIHFNDRICQFRIIENQPKLKFYEKARLGNTNRGGIGSTGVK